MKFNKKSLGIALGRLYSINGHHKEWDTSWQSEDELFYVWTAHLLGSIFEYNGTLYYCNKAPHDYIKHIDNLVESIRKEPTKFAEHFISSIITYSNSKNK